ncbi:MAG: pyrroline-5-carboxylate reductase [Desulfobacteraceae bacterium]|jgi:pyrroline-5-carboxylate reductase|nr:MAG: pyrroline-5-carboxylate reductase [Desulfobacteraceae bacterium]
MQDDNIGFIGAGNMAGALIKGLLTSGLYSSSHIHVSDKREEAVSTLVEQQGVIGIKDNASLVRHCSTVVLAVKPQNMREVLEEIREEVCRKHFLISIAAGIPIAMIDSIMGHEIAVARVMPNTPALVQRGISALSFSDNVTEKMIRTAENIFEAVGKTVKVNETMMDAVTAISGSGPGYVFRFMECLVEAGVSMGLELDISRALVVETFLGSACLAKVSEKPILDLRKMVTSPGGTTAAAISVLEKQGIEDILTMAVKAARRRASELGDLYK